MTQEEKAKAYDEALKVAKSNYETIVQMDKECTFTKEGIVNTFHHMFPELKEESEDERMKNYIISCLDNQLFTDGSQADIDRKNAIAWLEKQGEQRERIINKACDVLVDCIEDFMFRRMEVWSEECKKQTLENIRKTLEE